MPKVRQIFNETPLMVGSFSVEDIDRIMDKRIESLRISGYTIVKPYDTNALKSLHALYGGVIRDILNSLSSAISFSVKERPVVLSRDSLAIVLNKLAHERYLSMLTPKEQEIIKEMLNFNEVTNTQLSKKLGVAGQNISKYFNKLKTSGCVALRRSEGRQNFYTVEPRLRWLLLKP